MTGGDWTCTSCGHLNPAAGRFCGGCARSSAASARSGPVDDDDDARVDLSGEVLDGRYRLERRLGEGGMGEVYLARDERLGRQLAVKLLAPELTSSGRAWERMWQEGQTLAQIDDVNVVKVFDLFEASTASGRTLAMTMELMTGGDLRDRLNRGPIPWREACALTTGVLSGLGAIHRAGLVHRDIKPGNVLIAKNGTPKVTDLGIARDMSGRMQTRTGQAIGTSAYMSPEQVKGEKVDERTDVYAVGLLLYELIVGVSPYEGVPDYRLPIAQAEQVVDLAPVAASGAGAIVAVLRQALSKDAGLRPESVEAMRRGLADALSGVAAPWRAPIVSTSPESVPVVRTQQASRVECPPGTAHRPSMAVIPAGTFTMGSPTTEKERYSDEGPQHQVTLSRFLLASTPVTQGQYAAVMDEHPSHFKGSEDLPVEQVSWNGAVAYCNALSKLEGLTPAYQVKTSWFSTKAELITSSKGYRLPTEAEWEYACRAGTTTRFWSGDDESDLARVAWYSANSGDHAHPVGQKGGSPWGLYDMHGNIWEWCHDRHGNYGAKAQINPVGPRTNSFCVFRGGNCFSTARGLRATNRGGDGPGYQNSMLGFRPARSAP